MLADKELQKFKAIYFEEFGEEIDDVEARRMSGKLITLIKTIACYIGEKEELNGDNKQKRQEI